MNNNIQEIITSIYDWFDANLAFKVVSKASHFCSTENFLYHSAELHSLLIQARTILNGFSDHIEKVNLCLINLNGEINREVSKKRITKEQLDLLLRDDTSQIKIKDLLIIAYSREIEFYDLKIHQSVGRIHLEKNQGLFVQVILILIY